MPASILCPEDHELLPLTTGEPPPPGLQEHLRSCPKCQGRLRQLQNELSFLRSHSWQPREEAAAQRAADDRLTAIGQYLVVGRLGGGRSAAVYRALHPVLGHEVTIKLARRTATVAERDRVLAQGRTLSGLRQPHLVRVLDLDFYEGRPFLVSEYVAAPDLRRVAQDEPPNPVKAAALIAKVARAVAAVHRAGLAHGAIKPANILLDASGEPRLTGIGLGYFHPEGPDRDRTAREAKDVADLGGVLFFLLTGQMPDAPDWLGSQPGGAGSRERLRDALKRADVPSGLAAVCLRAIAPEPSEQFTSADDLAAALEQPPRRAVPVLWLAAATVILALAALAVWWALAG